ncbi:DUF1963 domain-containing protein [Rhizobiales bacterium RZME27]|uniref:DUF1963 domain-containing protein n=1 Tax=Endobacterium cereale TaxID=2663029 RepID=A0A6A8AAC2_9HYPH|nr:DUF1963 domain-containing protein [Endobacterium cereale]MEB2844297.1 DUF1963 domain-containing protein [Endobacterium cereale]MQY46888.1 DUF1963 domain-containing protein [Endobacterium cereale]
MKQDFPQGFSRRFFLAGCATTALAVPVLSVRAAEPAGPTYFPDIDSLAASLEKAGVPALDRRNLLPLAKPTIIMRSKAMPDNDLPVGCGKFGGAPDLPAEMPWPTRGPSEAGKQEVEIIRTLPGMPGNNSVRIKEELAGREAPLAFVMQIDLAACAAAGAMDPDIPTSGLLSIFFDFVFRPWFAESRENSDFRLIYTAVTDNLVRRPIPDLGLGLWGYTLEEMVAIGYGKEDMHAFTAARLYPDFTYSLPDAKAQPVVVRYGLDAPHRAWLEKLNFSSGDGGQVGGWPLLIQQDPANDLGAADLGQTLSGYDYIGDMRKISPAASEWMTLVTFAGYDSDSVDFDGTYYVMMRRSDLKARDFSKACIVYQTS